MPTIAEEPSDSDCAQAWFKNDVDLATALNFPAQRPLCFPTMKPSIQKLSQEAQRLAPVLVHVIAHLKRFLPQWQRQHQAALWAPAWQQAPDIGAAWGVLSDAEATLAEFDRHVEAQDAQRLARMVDWTSHVALWCPLAADDCDLAAIPRLRGYRAVTRR
jgi:hypothetical protein